jgi:cell filamentation protein
LSSPFADPYCFPGTQVLRNLAGIRNRDELEKVESVMAALAGEPLYRQPPHLTDLAYLKAIHHTLFGQLYPWAGETRRNLGPMTKTRANGSVVLYGDSSFVDAELNRILALLAAELYLHGLTLQRFATRAGYFYGELDAIHPFREGNSRTLRVFFHSIAFNAGFRLDWGSLAATEEGRDTLYVARDRAVMHGDSSLLTTIFAGILSPI